MGVDGRRSAAAAERGEPPLLDGGQPPSALVVDLVDEPATARDHAAMHTRQRLLTAIGIAALVVAVAYAVADLAAYRAAGSLVWLTFAVIPFFAVGIWLVRRRPEHLQARRLLLLAVVLAVGTAVEGPLRHGFLFEPSSWWVTWLNLLSQFMTVLSVTLGGVLFGSYPDGVVERPWQRRVLAALWAQLALPPLLLLTTPQLMADQFLLEVTPPVPSPLFVQALAGLGPLVEALFESYIGAIVGVVVLLVRFVRVDALQRRRMRLMVYTATAAMVITIVGGVLPESSAAVKVVYALAIPTMAAVPLAIVVGVLQHRLYDIDVTVRRSVVYAALVVAIAAVYIVVTAAPGLAFGAEIPVEAAVLITVGAAVAFQPLRRRLERWADRRVFGARIDRYRLLTAFGSGLEQTVELARLLPRLADTVRSGLDASWVRVTLPGTEAVVGDPTALAELTVVLPAGGWIECGPKSGGYDDNDRELLTTLVAQASTAIENVALTAQLAERLEELRASRARIVAASDAERRRIERDLHDGVQQHVVALLAKIRLARNAVGRGDDVTEQLAAVQTDAADLMVDLRELAHGIHPPVLSDRGLVEAIETRADRMPVPVATRADPALRERRFAADVEAAAYYVVCEALTNVVKHADARTAAVELSAVDGRLTVLVRDDGSGGAAADKGHGLTNLRDRVEALGGRLHVTGSVGAGSRVAAELPVGGHG
jgi:signal transduction histidine kinase